jgi:hypothetical protein
MSTATDRRIPHNGKHVALREILDGSKFIAARIRYGHTDVCPLCKARFTENNVGHLVMFISNQAGVPNRFVHGHCMASKTDEYAWALIAEDYDRSKQYADWYEL